MYLLATSMRELFPLMIDLSPYPNIRPTSATEILADVSFAPHQTQLAELASHGEALLANEFDLLDYAALAPGICIIDVERDPERFRYRFIGSDIVMLYGRDNTGNYMDEIAEELGDAMGEHLALFRGVVAGRRPLRHSTSFDWVGRGFVELNAVDYPLFDAAGQVTQILCIILFRRK